MSSNKTSFAYTEYLFRPVYEVKTAMAWGAAALVSPLTGFAGLQSSWSITMGVTTVCGTGALHYTMKSIPMIKKQMGLMKNTKTFMPVSKLRRINSLRQRATQRNFKDPKLNLIGYGFEWGAEHAQRAYQVMNLDSNLSGVAPPWPFNRITKKQKEETAELGGKSFLHAMGEEKLITAAEDAFYGHTLIAGNIGTGKTTLLKMLSLNALHMSVGRHKKILVVLDPKNDAAWRQAIQDEMTFLGMGEQFYFLHPAKQSESCRIPLLKNYVRVTEIADRIAPLMGASGDSKSFEDFAYEQITLVAMGMEYIGMPIRLTSLRDNIGSRKFTLCEDVLKHYMKVQMGNGWESTCGLTKFLDKNPGATAAEYLSNYYKSVMKDKAPEQAIEGIIQLLEHPHEHYMKMITSLKPVLTALTSKPMDDLFSPLYNIEDEDPRDIVDLEKLMETGGCLYVSLDSLTDSKTASYISRLLSAEIAAVAGRRYNNEDTDAPRVSFFQDEAHAALQSNEALLSLAAQGRAAQIELYLATQTVSDLEAKTDPATAKRILGLMNNFISTRTTDPTTQEYVAEQFSKTSITQVQVQRQSGVSTGESLFNFSSTEGARAQQTSEYSFPPQLLGDLPKLQYIARMADGRKLKMRLPIITNDTEGETASWL